MKRFGTQLMLDAVSLLLFREKNKSHSFSLRVHACFLFFAFFKEGILKHWSKSRFPSQSAMEAVVEPTPLLVCHAQSIINRHKSSVISTSIFSIPYKSVGANFL